MRSTRARLAIPVIGLLLLTVAGCSSTSGALETVGPATAVEMLEAEDVVLLDIRTPEEYNAGIIDGAVNIDFYAPDFSDRIDALDRDVHYIVYCRSGSRSAVAMETFEHLGFDEVTEIEGGIVNWQTRGLPIVSP